MPTPHWALKGNFRYSTSKNKGTVLLFGSLSQTLDLDPNSGLGKFAMASWLCCQKLSTIKLVDHTYDSRHTVADSRYFTAHPSTITQNIACSSVCDRSVSVTVRATADSRIKSGCWGRKWCAICLHYLYTLKDSDDKISADERYHVGPSATADSCSLYVHVQVFIIIIIHFISGSKAHNW